MMELTHQKIDLQTLLLATLVDDSNILVWSKTKDAEHGRNKPKSVRQMLTSEPETQNASFDSVEEYESARSKILERNKSWQQN